MYVNAGKDEFTNFSLDLGLNNTQYALVTGSVYTIVSCISAVILGYQVDRYNRKYLIFVCSLLWNIIQCMTFFVQSFWQILAIRIAFAVLNSVHTPACVSLIKDFFQHEARSRANSCYVAAVSLGVGFANLTSIMNEVIGWRNSSLVVGAFGIFVTFLITFLEEPPRMCEKANQFLLQS